MHFLRFLNRKLPKSSVKTKGEDVIKTLPVTMKEELGLKREVEGSEMLRL